MAIEKAKELLEAIRTDPKAKELLQGVSEPRSEEDMIRLCAEIAPKLGFDVSEADIREAVAALSRERMEKTAADVQKLSDDDITQASGGELWQGEDAPDGHEMGCMLTYHGFSYQWEHKIWCSNNYYCLSAHNTPPLCRDMYS